MDEQAKQRAVGAIVIVGLAIIFVPLILDFGSDKRETPIDVAIPPASQDVTTISIPLDSVQDKVATSTIPAAPPAPHDVNPTPVHEPAGPAHTPSMAAAGDDDIDEPALVGGGPIEEPVARSNSTPSKSASSAVTPIPSSTSNNQAASSGSGSGASPSKSANAPSKPDANKLAKVDPKPNPAVTGARAWAVQVASFSERKSAAALQQRLQKKGYRAFTVTSQLDNRVTVRVRIGPDLLRAEAEKIRSEVERDFKLQAMIVQHR